MKKTFQLRPEGKHPDRVLEAIKHEVRKYIKRERRRPMQADTDFLDFDCKFGTTAETAEAVHLSALTALMDGVAKEAGPQFYVEILGKPGHRTAKPASDTPALEGNALPEAKA